MIGYIFYCIIGCMFFVFGIVSFKSRKAVGFWTWVAAPVVTDVKAYNRAVGKLWCVSGIFFVFIGLPLLAGQNSPLVLLSVVGIMIWAITLMVIYELGIMRKYRKE